VLHNITGCLILNFTFSMEQVIDLLLRVCTVSVETTKIVREMPD